MTGLWLESAVGVACVGYLVSIYGRRGSVSLGDADVETPHGSGSFVEGVRRRLVAAGLEFGPGIYGWVLAGTGIFLFFLGQRLAGGKAAVGAGVMLAGIWAVDRAVRVWGRHRAARFEARLVDAVDSMVAALNAGQSLQQAVESAAESSREPVRSELERWVRLWRLGLDFEQGLVDIRRRYDSEGTRLWCQTLIAKSSVGGELAPVLSKVNGIIRQRSRLRRRLKSRLAGSQMSAILVTLLPYVLLPVYFWQRPEWYELLRTEADAHRLLLAAAGLQVLGLLWIRRILRMEL